MIRDRYYAAIVIAGLIIEQLVFAPRLVHAQTPTPAKGGFVLPVSPVPTPKPPTPTPAPIIDDNTPTVLPADSLYVITNTSDGIVKAVTTDPGKKASSIVKITTIKGPVTIITKFIYGTARETRVIPGPFIWTVEAVGPGTVKLLLMPKTLKDETSIAEQLITTNTAPIPPPDPIVPPDPPVPVDPLTATLQAALAKETAADKLLVGKLAAAYKGFAGLANDPTVATAGDLLSLMHEAASNPINGVGTGLPNVRAVLAAEMKNVLPKVATTPLDTPTRATAAAEFQRFSVLIGGLK